MSHAKPESDKQELFPSSWTVGPAAAAELARGDDDVLVAPELLEEDLKPLSGGRPRQEGSSFDDLWTGPDSEARPHARRDPAITQRTDDGALADAAAALAPMFAKDEGAVLPPASGDADGSDSSFDDLWDARSVDDDLDRTGVSADHDDTLTTPAEAGLPDAGMEPSAANPPIPAMPMKEDPDPAEIEALWIGMDDLKARFTERERTTSRLRLEPTMSPASLETAADAVVERPERKIETASLGIRLTALAAVLLAALAVGHRFDIPSAGFWEQVDRWVLGQASGTAERFSSLVSSDHR